MTTACPPVPKHRPLRRAIQFATLVALVLVPALGLFRIDLAAGSLLVFDRAVNLRNFPAVAGLAIVVATAPLVLVSTLGTFWCGWACPQNAVSEWANGLTRRLLGARADVNVEGAGLQVAPSKNRLRNWAVLLLQLGLAGMLLGIVPLWYFFPPDVVWSLVSGDEHSQLSSFVFRLYIVTAGLAFVDVALVRYFLCNYVCLYRFGLLLFRRPGALAVQYDAARAPECAKCNYCRVACVTNINPTDIQRFDRCINCAECIDACARLHARDEPPRPGLLRFDDGPRDARGAAPDLVGRILEMLGWHGLLMALGMALLAWGLFVNQSY